MQITPKNNPSSLLKSTEELRAQMHEVLEIATDMGASDAVVAVSQDNGFSVDVRMGEVETVAFGADNGVALTVYYGHQKGGASTTDMGRESLITMVKAACDIARMSAADPCFGLPEKELLSNQFPDLDLYHPWAISPEQAIQLALRCEQTALAADERICNSDGVSVSTYSSQHGFANTRGGEGVIHSSRHGLSCSLIARQDEDMQRDYDYSSVRDPALLISPEQLARQAAERTVSRLGARQLKTQKVPVVFSSRVASGLFSSFINAISGSNLYKKNSFLLDSLGEQIFPSFMNIYEQPYLPGALGSSPYDGEGVPTRENVFIEAGQLRQYVLGTYSARRLGMQTTANAGGVHNLTIDANASGLEEILAAMGTGLLVTELMGQGVNIITGDYSRGASGFWVEKGEIQFPVHEVTIAGNLKSVFQSIQLVGADLNPNIATRCGSVLVSEMMLAGA